MGISLNGATRSRSPGVRSSVYVLVLLLFAAGMAATPVLAKALDLDKVVRFAIEPQPIESALIAFSRQAHIQVVISPDANGTAEAPALNRTVTARVALDTLLRNTGLTYAAVGESVSVTRAGGSHSTNTESGSHQDDSKGASSSAKEGKKTPYEFRTAQLEQGATASSSELKPGSPGSSTAAQLPEVVIKGHYEFLSVDTSGTTNLPLPIEQVPQSISLVSNDFIQAADLKTLGAIAEYTPGAINIGNTELLGTTIKLRGFPAGRSIDAINIITAYTYFEPDYANYDRLEIVKGPSSVVYGVSSPGGLVNYVTKSATAQTPSYLYAQAGSWDSYRIEGQVAGALDPDGHVRAIGVAVRDQGDSFTHQVYHKKTSIYGGLNVDLGNSVTAYLHGGYERQEEPSFDGIPAEPDGSPAPVARSFFIGSRDIVQTHDIYYAVGDLTWHATDMMDLSIKGNYQTVRQGGRSVYSAGLQSNGDLGIYGGVGGIRNWNYGIGVSSIYRFDNVGLKNSFVSLAALYQAYDDRANSSSPVPGTVNIFDGEAAISQAFDSLLAGPLPNLYNQETKATTLTVSGQSVLQVIEPLTILLGVSYSKPKVSEVLNGVGQDLTPGGQISYRAGVTYEFLPKTYAYVSYSQSFNPQALVAVSVLPPIKGEEYELGVKHRDVSGRLLLTAAAFQIREENLAQYSYTNANGFDVYTTAGQVTHRGLELQSIGQITRQWQINAGYTYLDPKITKGNSANPGQTGQTELFLPKQTFSLYTTYTLHDGFLRGLSFGGGARYVSSERTSYESALANMEAGLTPTRDLPGYTLVDLNLGYSVGKWFVQLNAHNIFDRHYFINYYQTLFYGNTVGDPANVALSVRRQF